MHTLTLNIQDTLLDKVLHFLQNLPKNEISIVENRLIDEYKDVDYWSEEEIDSIGKIGFISSSFEDDNEDYSKW
ncbi:hypothetical protein MNB_SV-15-315 [hydrothermal vent metagenome]|uniref:Uncharacterized protein n=1 Tax=hydrothermal vent metagenome TaxID=652676 RepID=A0A1W1EIU1_9ZZZZ